MASSALSSAMPQRDIKVLQVLLKSWSLTQTPLSRRCAATRLVQPLSRPPVRDKKSSGLKRRGCAAITARINGVRGTSWSPQFGDGLRQVDALAGDAAIINRALAGQDMDMAVALKLGEFAASKSAIPQHDLTDAGRHRGFLDPAFGQGAFGQG
jgi:hypothetical protein